MEYCFRRWKSRPITQCTRGHYSSVVRLAGQDDGQDGHLGRRWWMQENATSPRPTIDAVVSGAGADRLRQHDCVKREPWIAHGPGALKVPAGSKTGAFYVCLMGIARGSRSGGQHSGRWSCWRGRGGTGSRFGGGGNIASIQIPGMSVKGSAPPVPGRRPRSPGGFSDMQTIDDPSKS